MAARQEVLKACADWRTLREVQTATGLSIGYLRSLRAEFLEGGYLEERFEDGIGRQYRATGKVCPEWEAPSRKLVLESLSGGPKTARQIADGTGMARKDATNALARMEALGIVAREGTTRFTWRLVRWPRGTAHGSCAPAGRPSPGSCPPRATGAPRSCRP